MGPMARSGHPMAERFEVGGEVHVAKLETSRPKTSSGAGTALAKSTEKSKGGRLTAPALTQTNNSFETPSANYGANWYSPYG